MSSTARPAALPRGRFGPAVAIWLVVLVAVTTTLALRDPSSFGSQVIGNVAIMAALAFSATACLRAARRRTPARRGWSWMAAAMIIGGLGQALFLSAVLARSGTASSALSDALGYLGYALPSVVALFLFPRPPERLISRFRSVLDAIVITVGVVMVSEAGVLSEVRAQTSVDRLAGFSGLAFPVADLAICAVVLTLGMRQPARSRLVWLCMGGGLVTLAVTDSIYVRLMAEGYGDLTGSVLVAGWLSAPTLIGLATFVRPNRAGQGWDLALPVQLVPYVPVLGAALIFGLQPRTDDLFLMVSGAILMLAVTVRQVMIVYENLTLTRDLETKVAERTADLATVDSIVISSTDAIVGLSMAGTIKVWNPAAELLYGFRHADVIDQPPRFLTDATQSFVDELLDRAVRGEAMPAYEVEWTRPDRTTIPIAMSVSPILDDQAVVQGISVIAQDITERRREAEDLEQARQDALESARMKSEFLATMSHEIRTPMNGVIGLTSLLVDTELDEVQRRYAEGVQDAGQALLTVINDILDFSKLEAGRVELESLDFELQRLVEEVGSLLAPAAFAKGLELVVDCPPGSMVVRGDVGRIRQILLNLASNAIKFTADGEVVIRVREELAPGGDVALRFDVTDTGIGVAEEDRGRLFDSFSQADASTTRRYGGTGLGLAICRRLVEEMDGTIGLDSTLGEGSVFWFEINLPVGEAIVAVPGRPVSHEVLRGLRVLVVDDNANNRAILQAQLSSWQMRVDLVDNALSALDRLREARTEEGRPFDLAVLDVMMPQVDGLELARMITADPDLTGLPMLVLTSAFDLASAELESLGVKQWLTKPVSRAQLLDRMTRLIDAEGLTLPPAEPEFPTPTPAAPVPSAPAPAPTPAASSRTGRRPAEPVADPRRGRILVVEDNALNQLVAAGLVAQLGYEVDTVSDGEQAVDAVHGTAYAAVLMDCNMPVMDGLTATREIRRQQGSRPYTPVIAMTAGAMASDRERCLAAGMDDYVSKPVDSDALRTALSRWARLAAAPEPEPAAAEPGVVEPEPLAPVDPERLEQLRSLRAPDGRSLLASFVALFVDRADDRLEAIRAAVDGRDLDVLAAVAHELKGSAGTIGAARVAAVCARIEREARDGEQVAPPVVDELEGELRQAVDELRAVVGSATPVVA